MHAIPIAGCDPMSFLFGFCFGGVFRVCLLFLLGCFFVLLFLVCFLVCSLAGTVSGLRTGPQPALLWRSKMDSPCNQHLPRLNECNDLAEAMKALDGEKKRETACSLSSRTWRWACPHW